MLAQCECALQFAFCSGERESCSPAWCRTAEALLSGACRDQLENCQPRACSERCNDSVCCASLCTFRSAAPKMRIKTFAGNIEQGRPLPMILDPQKTRGISVMLVSEAAGCCTIADVPHSLPDDFEVLLDLEPSPCQHRPHRPSLAWGSAPTPSPITCPVHSSDNS